MSSSHVKFLKASITRNIFIKDKFENIVASESQKKKKHNPTKHKNSQQDGKPDKCMENDKRLIQNQ